MNVDNGELMRVYADQLAELPDGFTPVPESLREEANNLLRENDRVMVDMSKNTPLVNWAKCKRKRKISKVSKKRNRR